jgi:hypothetical protein
VHRPPLSPDREPQMRVELRPPLPRRPWSFAGLLSPILESRPPFSRRSWSCGWNKRDHKWHKGNHNSKIAEIGTAGVNV